VDSNLNPKIADFGLARLFDEDETHVRTIVVVCLLGQDESFLFVIFFFSFCCVLLYF
jgi:phage shock protein PspC (stress-responsive transcriptional regulator)